MNDFWLGFCAAIASVVLINVTTLLFIWFIVIWEKGDNER